MDGLIVLLALAAIAVFILGPVGFFVAIGHGGRLRALEATLAELRGRLVEAERRFAAGVEAPAERAPEADVARFEGAEEPPPAVSSIAPLPAIAGAEAPQPVEAPEPPAEPASPPAPPPPSPPRASLEERLGARWTVWVGAIAVGLGALLLVRYSIEQGFFGPAARVGLGLALAIVLLGLGERLRRGESAPPAMGSAAWANAPAALTGAGIVAAFGSVYAAHALYGFIGATPAFLALGGLGLAALALASLHGPALAGLGLIGAEAAPLLVSSDHPSPWPVVIYLLPVAAAAYGLALLRGWLWLALATAAGGLVWVFLLSGQAHSAQLVDVYHAMLAVLVSQTTLAAAFMAVAPHRGGADGQAGFDRPASGVLAAFSALAVLALVQPANAFAFDPWWIVAAALFVAVLAIAGALAAPVAAALALAGAATLAVLAIWPAADPARALDLAALVAHWRWPPPLGVADFVIFALIAALGVATLAAGRLFEGRRLSEPPAVFYAGAAGLTPLGAILIADARIADGAQSIGFAGAACGLAVLYALAASQFQRRLAQDEFPATRLGLGALASATIASLAAGLVFALDGGALTVSLALAALATAYVSTRLGIPALRWCVAGFGVAVAARLAWEPRIVGAALSPTPIFNGLLYGYGVPALAFGFAGRLLRREREDTPARVADALAVLFSAFLVFFEIRHATNGGDPFTRGSGLVEEGLMAVSSFGFALVLTRLDSARANAVFRLASLAAGPLGAGIAVVALLLRWNPFLDGVAIEGGAWINTLLLGYALPAALAAALALAARRVRPPWYWGGAAIAATALGAAYVFLELRALFHGALIGADQGFTLAELGLDAAAPLALAVMLDAVQAPLDRSGRILKGLFALSAIAGLLGLALAENPLLTDAPIAGGAAINALIVAYALPAALTAWLGSRLNSAPMRVAAILWFFAYVSLETRRAFHGAAIGETAGLTDTEVYTFSAVWLALGLALLAYGVVRGSREARYASAFFVVATTLKVFTYDLSGLEGALRAFSFIGLGLALIAIGLVYQKLVFASPRAAAPAIDPAPN
ncbi:MAG: DUF2339 domain-containing protein [Bradyrhizobium sp.]|nr:MAG: DUF2339 domain-containing protein [Bradyrhizobium sp.]